MSCHITRGNDFDKPWTSFFQSMDSKITRICIVGSVKLVILNAASCIFHLPLVHKVSETTASWRTTYIQADLTPHERRLAYELRQERNRRLENGETDLIIRNGKILKKRQFSTDPPRLNRDRNIQNQSQRNRNRHPISSSDEEETYNRV
ncbi:unnamed protein product [Owenia fusiformis]|uniref:Uncharacterized protein n=1 Tax=Owenia fusiformis TaxID=6347 RepID=A0A8J1TEW0_OWEFU|nr:unnamed protein product [Owenia fusiformis]